MKEVSAGNQRFDVAVIGGGPGGYVAALRAAQLGATVALVEKGELGGVCLNEGCIPTKALIQTASRYHSLTRQQEYGIEVRDYSFDFPRARQRDQQVVKEMVRGVERLLRAAKVRIRNGTGRLLDRQTVGVALASGGMEQIRAERIILASGSVAATLPVPGLERPGNGILFNREALALAYVPKSILVIGAGPVGLEFVQILARLGAEVTLVEMLSTIAPAEDPEITRLLDRLLRRERIRIMTGCRVTKVEDAERGLKRATVTGEDGEQTVAVEAVLVAVGRRPNTDGLGLESVGIKTAGPDLKAMEGYGGVPGMRMARGAIPTNERMETVVPGIYAIGDVTGGWLLAHVASHQGEVAAENALGHASVMDYRVIPRVIYTQPEAASVGLTEAQAVEQGYDVRVGRFPLAGNGRALIMGESIGMAKIVADARTGEVLGGHLLGPEAGELLGEISMAIHLRMDLNNFAGLIHPHPTVSEAIRETALAGLGRPLHGAQRPAPSGRTGR